MGESHLIVDGNNLIHHFAGIARLAAIDFDQARLRLLQRLDEVAGALPYDRITVVFDGSRERLQSEPASPNIRVVFSPASLTADSVIERMVHEAPEPGRITVATSDRSERHTVEAAGAITIGGSNFVEDLDRCRRDLLRRGASARRDAPRATLGDFFPPAG